MSTRSIAVVLAAALSVTSALPSKLAGDSSSDHHHGEHHAAGPALQLPQTLGVPQLLLPEFSGHQQQEQFNIPLNVDAQQFRACMKQQQAQQQPQQQQFQQQPQQQQQFQQQPQQQFHQQSQQQPQHQAFQQEQSFQPAQQQRFESQSFQQQTRGFQQQSQPGQQRQSGSVDEHNQRFQSQVSLNQPQQQLRGSTYDDNPFFSGAVNPPSSSSFQVAPQPVPQQLPRATTEAPYGLNTHPLGGPAGPKGPVAASCPGSESALPCVPDAECDPFTGYLVIDEVKLPYNITKDTPTVAIGQCLLDGGAAVGVCCKRLPRPASNTAAPQTSSTAVPLGIDYTQGLASFNRQQHQPGSNVFLPDYRPQRQHHQ